MKPADADLGLRDGNVAHLHEQTAEHHGDLPALEVGDDFLTHAELSTRTATFAGGLRDLGLEPGDRILHYLPNCPQYIIAVLGSLKAGTVLSPINPQYKAREITHQLDDTDAEAVITHAALRDQLAEALDELGRDPVVITVGDELRAGDVAFENVVGERTLADVDSDDVALQPYTSGTTGKPKGVLLTHGNLWVQGLAGMDWDKDPIEMRSLIFLPMYHITGLTHCALQPLVYGGSLYVRNPANWDAGDAMRIIEEEEIASFIGVTAMYVDMVNHEAFGDYDLSSLEFLGEGGAKMSVAVQREVEETAGVEMSEGYGLTETTGATHSNHGALFGPQIGTVGQPLRMTDCKIVDQNGEEVPPGEEGELLVRGPQVMKGYHELPEATEQAFTENGYFRTGDIATRDPDNYYEIVDRKKHVIVSAGYNIYPSEIEELLHEHEAVAEAAVVGIPDERRNEIPKAFVVPKPETDVTPEMLKEYALDNLAEYKHPREVEFVDELPRTASGKIQKFKLTEEE